MPTSFRSQRSLLRSLVLSPKVQADFGDPLDDADLTYTALMETNNFAQIDQEMESDYNYAGKGHSFATDSRVIALKSSMEFSTRVDQFLAGWLLAMCMGKDVIAGAGPYTHTITWLDTNVPRKVSNLYVEDTEGLKRRFIDMTLSQLVLTGREKGSIMAKASFLGTGKYADGAMAALPARITHPQFLYGSDAQIKIGPQGGATSYFPRVLSWEATFDHQDEELRAPGGGLYAAFLRPGNPLCKLKLVIAADESTDIRDWAVASTALECEIKIDSGAAELKIFYPYIVLPKEGIGEDGKYVAFTLDLDETTILKPDAAEICTVTVKNTQATAYLLSA
jgi:hypothetical protein